MVVYAKMGWGTKLLGDLLGLSAFETAIAKVLKESALEQVFDYAKLVRPKQVTPFLIALTREFFRTLSAHHVPCRYKVCLTFELTGPRWQDAKPGLAKRYRIPPARAWWPAVAAPVERGVRPHRHSFQVGPERKRSSLPVAPLARCFD